jgi:hypothetical protein
MLDQLTFTPVSIDFNLKFEVDGRKRTEMPSLTLTPLWSTTAGGAFAGLSEPCSNVAVFTSDMKTCRELNTF